MASKVGWEEMVFVPPFTDHDPSTAGWSRKRDDPNVQKRMDAISPGIVPEIGCSVDILAWTDGLPVHHLIHGVALADDLTGVGLVGDQAVGAQTAGGRPHYILPTADRTTST